MLVVLTEGRSEPRRTRLVIVYRCRDVTCFRSVISCHFLRVTQMARIVSGAR